MLGESTLRGKGCAPLPAAARPPTENRHDERAQVVITGSAWPSTSEPVLVSACLAGRACRYDGSSDRAEWVAGAVASGRAVLVCPEQDGGLPTPRPPAEIVGGDGDDVLDGRARVVTAEGRDVTDHYVRGAEHALRAARRAGATTAVLKARSPSCGHGQIYDGSFSGNLVAGDGVTAALLRRHGIAVVGEDVVEGRPPPGG